MKPFAWSYSALTTYELCPKKYYHLYVAKDFKDEDSSFAADGKFIHDAMFQRVIHGKALPLKLRHYEKMAARFADAQGEKHGEMKFAINRKFEQVDYFAKDVYLRIIVDLLIVQGDTAIIVDWKTGKKKDDPTQMALVAAVLSRVMPEIKHFKTLFVWLSANDLTPHNYEPPEFVAVWNDLLPRANAIEEARKTTNFPANPAKAGKLCGYCPVRSCPHFIARDA